MESVRSTGADSHPAKLWDSRGRAVNTIAALGRPQCTRLCAASWGWRLFAPENPDYTNQGYNGSTKSGPSASPQLGSKHHRGIQEDRAILNDPQGQRRLMLLPKAEHNLQGVTPFDGRRQAGGRGRQSRDVAAGSMSEIEGQGRRGGGGTRGAGHWRRAGLGGIEDAGPNRRWAQGCLDMQPKGDNNAPRCDG